MGQAFSDPHLASLQQRFPDAPASIILKADVLREGLRFTRDLGAAGEWAIPSQAFLSRERAPAGPQDGSGVPVPCQLIQADDTRINTELDRGSPYTVERSGEEGHVLLRQGEPVAEVSFPVRPAFATASTEDAAVYRALGQRAETCVALTHTPFCEYAKNGMQCAFCFLGNVMAGRNLGDLSPGRLPRPTQSIEACARAVEQIEIDHVVVSGGAFIDTHLEARSYVKTISALRQALGPEPRITAVCQAMQEEDWAALKEAGASRVQPNLEVWHDDLWPVVVPGKASAIGKAEWIERLGHAVDVFGVGEVATNFVAGAEVVEAAGPAGLTQAVESHVEAYELLLHRDIVPIFGFLTKGRGTRYESAELPPTDFFLRLGQERTRLMVESGMFKHYTSGVDADFACYRCVTHKTCQDYPRLLHLSGQDPAGESRP